VMDQRWRIETFVLVYVLIQNQILTGWAKQRFGYCTLNVLKFFRLSWMSSGFSRPVFHG
jgi:hypothetical protein